MDGRGTPGVLVVTDIPCSSTARSRDCRVFGTFTSDDGRTTLDRVKLAGAPVDVFAGRRIKVQRLASDSDVVYPSFYSHSWTTDAVLVGISLLVRGPLHITSTHVID